MFCLHLPCDHLIKTPIYDALSILDDPEYVQLQLQFVHAVSQDLQLPTLTSVAVIKDIGRFPNLPNNKTIS